MGLGWGYTLHRLVKVMEYFDETVDMQADPGICIVHVFIPNSHPIPVQTLFTLHCSFLDFYLTD